MSCGTVYDFSGSFTITSGSKSVRHARATPTLVIVCFQYLRRSDKYLLFGIIGFLEFIVGWALLSSWWGGHNVWLLAVFLCPTFGEDNIKYL